MIQALQITPEVLTSNIDNINFDTIDLRSRSANCCGWLQYMEGGSDFTLIGGGTFKISFNANVTSEEAGIVVLALKSSLGSDIEGTEMDAEITTPGTYTNISFTKLIRVCPRVNTTIGVGSLASVGSVTPIVESVAPTIKDANFIIEKIA